MRSSSEVVPQPYHILPVFRAHKCSTPFFYRESPLFQRWEDFPLRRSFAIVRYINGVGVFTALKTRRRSHEPFKTYEAICTFSK